MKKIPDESRLLLEAAIRLLQGPTRILGAEDIVLMVYNLGAVDGRMEQLDRSEAMVRDVMNPLVKSNRI